MSKLPDFSDTAPQLYSHSQPNTGMARRGHPSRHKASVPPSVLRWSILAFDIVAVCLVAAYAIAQNNLPWLDSSVRVIAPFILIPVSAIIGLSVCGAYRLSFRHTLNGHLSRTAIAAGAGLLVYGAMHALVAGNLNHWHGLIFLTWAVLLASHLAYAIGMKQLSRTGYLSPKVIIIGATPSAKQVIENNRKTGQYHIMGMFDDREDRVPHSLGGIPMLGDLEDLMNWERLPEVDRIIVTVTSNAQDRVRYLIQRLRVLPQHIVLILDTSGYGTDHGKATRVGNSPATYVSGDPVNGRKQAIKRLTDLVLGALLLIGFSPVMLACAIAIKLDDGGPIFFRQLRHGFNNELIRVWKFRSMRVDPQARQGIIRQTVAEDPRITRIGRLIRPMSIDELPQLLNVLTGEMSLVGPRPHAVGMTAEAIKVQEVVAEYAHRHRVKPGLTGWAQINGSRGPCHTQQEVRDRVRLDMDYLKRASFLFDIYIMIMTAPRLLGDQTVTR